jgi:hypothetical protein
MEPLPFCRRSSAPLLLAGLALGALFTVGCASPGPPRAPSLHLPQPVSDLTASRVGGQAELRFTVPHLSTDKLPLYSKKTPNQVLRGTLCREIDHHDCVAIAGLAPVLTASDHTVLTLHDELDATLAAGPRHLLGYRVEFFSPDGRSAGKSEAAFTASGPIPAPVAGLRASGTRAGILLQWQPASSAQDDVLLQRTGLAPRAKPAPQAEPPVRKPRSANSRSSSSSSANSGRLPAPRSDPEELWLNANSAVGQTLDDTVTAGEPYRYIAVRRSLVTLGARTFDLRSQPSAPIEFTLQPVYPPATPTGLTATGFQPTDSPTAHFAVDLIWQPVDDARITPQLAAPLAGYNVYREQLSPTGTTLSPQARLNQAPVPLPAFHDTTAEPAARYRYSVTSIDATGHESKAATFVLEPSAP